MIQEFLLGKLKKDRLEPMRLKKVGANQTEIEMGKWTILFSYDTPVAAFYPGKGHFKTEENHSVTTTKHINQFVKDARQVEKRPQSFFDRLTALF